ncbi:CYTH domain-containing protein [Flavobacteriaceae bacterium]|nr:CYTH domain-containing protein [Flavobacteriaceae bacterium]MDB9712936.1 CYTH domain-containing protein [Flavobacteriaceae bacterium]MDC1492097.1 CYTH domain-containing protein [Flavobacteriaceae bacterium]
MVEIERKFLVKSEDYKSNAFKVQLFSQAYLSRNPEKSIRVRIVEKEGFLTIKGLSSDSGLSRFEWEKKISLNEAVELTKLCGDEQIIKNRYFIKHDKVIIEVDEFLNENKGLVIAEVELKTINQKITLPKWIGKEVTGDNKYYNLSLISNPFTTW